MQKLPIDDNARDFDIFKSKGAKLSLLWSFLQQQGLAEIEDNSEPGEWHLWLTRDVALSAIRQLLQLMFSVEEPKTGDCVKYNKKWAKGQLRWHLASNELIWRCSQQDIYTKNWHRPQDLNSFIMPLSGGIWKAFNNTTLLFCLKTIEERERQRGRFGSTGQSVLSLREPDPPSDDDDEEDEKHERPFFDSFQIVSNVNPVEATAFFSMPDRGSTADGYD